MADTQLTLNAQEREYLVELLETALKNHRVEEHRTRAPAYREKILEIEAIITQLLTRLGQAPT